jgi:hypothetical protein
VKRKILRAVSVAAIAGAGLFAFSTPAQAHPGQWSMFNSGFGTGNQFSYVHQAPFNFCGNSIAILGFSSASCRGGAYAFNW